MPPAPAPSSNTNWPLLCHAALNAAHAAGAIHLHHFNRKGLKVDTKSDLTPVTVADRDSEHAVREILRKAAPEFGIYGEEFGSEGSKQDRWVIDPIDGTKSFIRGLPIFACLIGLEVGGVVQVGVMHAAALNETYWAWTGGGAWKNHLPIRVSGVSALEQAGLCYGGLREFRRTPARWRAFEKLAECTGYQRGFGDWWGHALVAEGKMDVMLDPVVEPYDVGPLPVILREAGGRFSDFAGAERLDGGTSLSSNGALHAAAVTTIGWS